MKKLFTFVFCTIIATTSAIASSFDLILPSSPGSASDIMGRLIQKELANYNNSEIRIEFHAGGDQILAVNRFKSKPQNSIMLGTSTIHVVNPTFKPNIPYGPEDFRHAVFVGIQAQVWYTSVESGIRNLSDLDRRLAQGRITVGADALGVQINAMSVKKLHPSGHNVDIITYKGSPQTLVDVIGRHTEVGVSSVSPQIIGMAQQGKIRILGSTATTSIMVGEQNVPSASQHWKIPQFGGLWILSVSPELANTAQGQRLIQDLYKMAHSDSFKKELIKQNIMFDGTNGAGTAKSIELFQQNAKKVKP
jgi:tripartite-type tricarboxylate transporter receptor subunit TctC